MISVVKVEIENDEVLQEYSKLIDAFTKKNAKAQTDITIQVEKILARTLFRGVTIASGAGKGNPDFQVTNDGLNDLLGKVASTADDMNNFNLFVSGLYASKGGQTVEAKIMRSQGDKDIKLGLFTPSLTQDSFQYFDFTSGDLIDTTKFSVVQKLRENYQSDPASQPLLKKELPTSLKKSDLASFIAKNKEFAAVLKQDRNINALDKLLSKNAQEVQSSAAITKLVDDINNTWASNSLESELTRLTRNGKLFEYIKKTPALDSQFYNKSRILSIVRHDNDKANALLVYFPYSSFTDRYFSAKYEEGAIKVYIKSDVEKIFLSQLSNETASLTLGNSLEDYDKAVSALASSGKFKSVPISSFNTEIKYLVPTGGSIPMSKGNFFNVKRKYKRPPFIRSGEERIAKYDKPASNFLSSEFLSLLVRQKVVRNMPHGPIGGEPLSRTKLTYRSGRFANSIQLLVNYRTRVVQYYYNPIYYIHEVTSRNPQRLIEKGINDVMREKFSQQFAIVQAK